MDRWWRLLLLLMTLAPMAVRLGMALSARRRIHILDDVICYLWMPLMFMPVFAPVPPVVSGIVFATGLALAILATWRDIRAYRLARRAERARVDDAADGR